MKDEELDRLLKQYGKPFESVKVPDESKRHLKEKVLSRIREPRPFALPASAGIAAAVLLALALGIFIYLYPTEPKNVNREAQQISKTATALPLKQAPSKTTPEGLAAPQVPENSLDQALDEMSEEELVLLVLELDDDELTLQLGDEFYAADLEAAEFAEWSA